MVLKRSVFEIQKQRTKNFKDPSYGCGAIHENVPKLRNCVKQKQNIRSKKYFDFTPYTDFLRAQLLIGRSPQKLKVMIKNVSKIQFYIKISSFDKKI